MLGAPGHGSRLFWLSTLALSAEGSDARYRLRRRYSARDMGTPSTQAGPQSSHPSQIANRARQVPKPVSVAPGLAAAWFLMRTSVGESWLYIPQRGVGRRAGRRDNPADAALELVAGKHHAAPTLLAPHADVSPYAGDHPLVASAWMGLAHGNHVIDLDLENAGHRLYTRVRPPIGWPSSRCSQHYSTRVPAFQAAQRGWGWAATKGLALLQRWQSEADGRWAGDGRLMRASHAVHGPITPPGDRGAPVAMGCPQNGSNDELPLYVMDGADGQASWEWPPSHYGLQLSAGIPLTPAHCMLVVPLTPTPCMIEDVVGKALWFPSPRLRLSSPTYGERGGGRTV